MTGVKSGFNLRTEWSHQEVNITGGWVEHDGCVLLDEYNLPVPDGVTQPGKNLLAVRATDDGGLSFVDLRILADQPLTGARSWELYR